MAAAHGASCQRPADIAVAVAERLGGEIVSADAFAVYRGFDAGTAKPSARLRERVPHHLVDARDPREPWSAGAFATEARRVCEEILARGHAVGLHSYGHDRLFAMRGPGTWRP